MITDSLRIRRLKATIKRLKAAAKWHPASKPPDTFRDVLAAYPDGGGVRYSPAFYDGLDWRPGGVTHWRELPNPPKARK